MVSEVWHLEGTRVVHAEFWWGDPREEDHLEDLHVDGKIILNWIPNGGMRKYGLDCSGSG
jgi:hypothetical protein